MADVERYDLDAIASYGGIGAAIGEREAEKYDAIAAMLRSALSSYRQQQQQQHQQSQQGKGAHHPHQHQHHHQHRWNSASHVRRGGHPHPHRAPPPLPRPARGVVTPARMITAALNKITAKNAPRVIVTVLDIVKAGQITGTEVACAVMVKGATDKSFMPLYVDLLSRLCEVDGQVDGEIASFVDRLFGRDADRKPRVLETLQAVAKSMAGISTEAYDGFCAALKAKATLLGQHNLALFILASRMSAGNNSNSEYIVTEVVMDVLDDVLSTPLGTGSDDKRIAGGTGEHVCDAALDIALDMILQVLPISNATVAIALGSRIKERFRRVHLAAYSAKSRFKVKDVIEWKARS
jgi:hypothetical protein